MGVAPNPNKLKLRGKKVTFMGYELTDEGKAMMEILKPTNVKEVQLLNGSVKHMYLAKFLPNLLTEWSRYTIENNTLAIKLKSNFTRYRCPTSSKAFKKFASMWAFEHLTNRPGNSKANAKSESAIRNSKNHLPKSARQWDASTWQFWTIKMHREIERCCQPFVHSTAACDTVVNLGIRFHVETLHIIPFEACSYRSALHP